MRERGSRKRESVREREKDRERGREREGVIDNLGKTHLCAISQRGWLC